VDSTKGTSVKEGCTDRFICGFYVTHPSNQTEKQSKCTYLHIFVFTEVMDEVAENLPPLEKIVAEIEELADSGGKYNEAPHVIEVTLPMLCSYLPFWWSHGPDNLEPTQAGWVFNNTKFNDRHTLLFSISDNQGTESLT